MGKLFKYLRQHAGVVLAIIVVLFVQAFCDLSLPTYTSDIVNVGIQQSGIDEEIPENISEEEMNRLLLFVSEDDRQDIQDAYEKSSESFDYDGEVLTLKDSVKSYCVGRDIENHELNLAFESNRWTVTDEESHPPSKDNIFLAAVYVFIKDAGHFERTATELIEALKTVSTEKFHANRVTRDLVQNGYKLKQCGIDFCCGRNHSGRKIILDYCSARDGSDSKNGSGVTVTERRIEMSQTSV